MEPVLCDWNGWSVEQHTWSPMTKWERNNNNKSSSERINKSMYTYRIANTYSIHIVLGASYSRYTYFNQIHVHCAYDVFLSVEQSTDYRREIYVENSHTKCGLKVRPYIESFAWLAVLKFSIIVSIQTKLNNYFPLVDAIVICPFFCALDSFNKMAYSFIYFKYWKQKHRQKVHVPAFHGINMDWWIKSWNGELCHQ